MNTENVQTDVTPSEASAESASLNPGQETSLGEKQAKETPTLDGLRELAKEKEQASFKPKPVEEQIKDAQPKPSAPVPPAFTPNYKYRAALQEKEIEEFWRPLIKDAESEKRVKDALTRLDGFDLVKSSRDK